MRRIVLVLLAVLGVGALTAVVLFFRAVASTATLRQEAGAAAMLADFERFRDRIDADEARWAGDPLFASRDGGNAAALLAEHVGWDPNDGGLPIPSSPVPAAVAALLRSSTDGGWLNSTDEAVLATDVRWFSELGAFGYWDPETHALSAVPFNVTADPVPDFVALNMFAKVRLIQGLHGGSIVAAAAEVRELARLTFSSETLLGSMIGTSLLGLERRAHEAAAAKGLDVTGWTPVSEADVERLKAVLWAEHAMTSVQATGALAARTPTVGLCAALREGVGSAFFLRPYLEREFPARYATLEGQLLTSPCRLTRLRTAWTTGSTENQLPADSRAFCVADPASSACSMPAVPFVFVPSARTFIGRTLVAIATPDWFKPYRKLETATSDVK